MTRIARVRIRWIAPAQHDSPGVLMTQPVPAPEPRTIDPRHWQVRVKWVGFGPLKGALSATQAIRQSSISAPTLWTLNLPTRHLRVRWLGFRSFNLTSLLALCVVVLLVGMFVYTQLGEGSATGIDEIEGPVVTELDLNGEPLTIGHSHLDMGQVQDLFDHDTVTLIRGLEANPFVLDIVFPTSKPITGLVMDFGGMDFDLRLYVYGEGESQPIQYEGQYRNQPSEPHVELDFVDGPAQVSRITIEIEQFNPPDEPHIHVREVLFKQ